MASKELNTVGSGTYLNTAAAGWDTSRPSSQPAAPPAPAWPQFREALGRLRDAITPPEFCEIPDCGEKAARRVFIMGSSRAWLCDWHTSILDVGSPLKADRPSRWRRPFSWFRR